MNDYYSGWNSDEHIATFDLWNTFSKLRFNFTYGCFAEQRYLLRAASRFEKFSILDVGCASGTTYRYLKDNVPRDKFEYRGIDLSQTAIARARQLYPSADFGAISDRRLSESVAKKYDVVYSRDTVMHQIDPFSFLDELIDLGQRMIIVRLRTRDHGATVIDSELSCQRHYDKFWMPYIVLNIDELLTHLRKNPNIARVVINRSYEVLGGQNYRFLPKDLYFTAAGGAETSMLVEIDPQRRKGSDIDVVFETVLEGHHFQNHHSRKRRILALLDRLLNALGLIGGR